MKRWLRVAALAGAVVALGAAGTPSALGAKPVGNAVLADCNSHGLLTHNYTLSQLRHALAIMPASFKEYGNCQDVIQAAIAKVRTNKPIVDNSSGSGGSFLPTPVIVILVLLILAALTFGALAVRRRRMAPGEGSDDDDPPADGPPPPAAS